MAYSFRNFFGSGGTGAAAAEAAVMAIVWAALADGRDGDADLDGVNDVPWCSRSGSVYTALRVGVPKDFRVRAGCTYIPAQFAGPLGNGDFLIEGTIDASGNNASGATGGTATAAQTFPATLVGGAGGAAGADNAGTAGSNTTLEVPFGRFFGAPGGAAAVAAGGAAPATNAQTLGRGTTHAGPLALGLGAFVNQAGVTTEQNGCSGSGGGGNAAGAGGGGGASGGSIYMAGRSLTVTSTGVIRALGGNGGAGGTSAGGGSSGAGGRIRLNFGTVTLADLLLSVQVHAGEGGAGGAGGFPGHCGGPGEIMYLSGKPSTAMAARQYRVALTSGERASAIVGGVLDVSGSFVVGSSSGRALSSGSTGTGGAGISIFEMATPDGELSLRYDAANFRLNLTVRGVVVLSTPTVNSNTTPGHCYSPFIDGDRVDWRIWYDPAGGARSMGLRWFVNRTGGYDLTGTASGSALSAATSASALSSSATSGTWGPAPAYILASRAADVVGTVVIIGDSICSPRLHPVGWDGVTVGSRMAWSTQVCVSLARPGAQLSDQLTAWQASTMRGNAACIAMLIMCGYNDIVTGAQTAAAVTTRAQNLVNDFVANNAAGKCILATLTPTVSALTAAQKTTWDTVQANFDGSGGTPVTGVHARATAHVATMGDVNKSLRERAENADFVHPSFLGRSLLARSFGAAYDSLGLTR